MYSANIENHSGYFTCHNTNDRESKKSPGNTDSMETQKDRI